MQKISREYLLFLNEKIAEIDEKITELRSQLTSPKAQIITDMPRGQAVGNAIENGIEKISHWEEKRAYFCDRLASEWLIIEDVLKECNIGEKQIELMKFRYFYGLKWKHCAKAMAKKYPNEKWNENKVFRTYRQIVETCIKKDFIIC